MYSITDLKKDVLIELGDIVYRVIDYQHTKMGRGGAVAKTKLKNLSNGSVLSRSFKGNEKIAPAQVDKVDMQYLYMEGKQAILMDTNTFEQLPADSSVLGDGLRFVPAGSTVITLQHEGKVIGLELPNQVGIKVSHTAAGVRGDTAKAAMKEATLESGASVQVPLFINTGDVIKVDTRTGRYLERQK